MSKRFSDIIQSEIPVLVDFSAEWCGPCKMMAPILKQLKDELQDAVTIIKIDVDRNQEAAQHFNIQGVPTLMIFRKGDLKWRQSGVMGAKELADLVKKFSV